MNGLRWSADDMPECLKDYDGQFALTLWYKAASKMFRTSCPTGRHFRSFKFHQNCFVAFEAVTWLQEQLKTDCFKVDFTREQTLALMQTMQRLERMFVDVREKAYDTDKIQDNRALYRFCDYEAFGDWGSPCQALNNHQICEVEIARGLNCNSSCNQVEEIRAENTNCVVQEQKQEPHHSPKSSSGKLPSPIAPHPSINEEMLARELFGSPAFGKVNFTLGTCAKVTCTDTRKAPRGCVPRLSAHEAALEEKWSNGYAELPDLHRRNSASRLRSQFLKTGETRAHRKRVTSLSFRSRKEFTDNAGLRDRSNNPLQRTESTRRNPALSHGIIRCEFGSCDAELGVHAQLSRNLPADENFMANDWLKMGQVKAFESGTLRKELNAGKASLFEPAMEPEMDFEPLIKSNSYLLQAKTPSELQLLLDFCQRLQKLLSVKDLNFVFDTSIINLTNLLDNLCETRVSLRDEELFPGYVLEVLQSLVNWPTGEVSTNSRCLTHAFDFMENYFTCVIDPLFTYRLYPVFEGVTETLRRNERQKKHVAAKENALSQKNQFCICLQDNAHVFETRKSSTGLPPHCIPPSNESSVSRKSTCARCSILSEDFDGKGSNIKKTMQNGITLPRNAALEIYLRRNSSVEVDTGNTSPILSMLSVESNELYETALMSFDEFEVDVPEEQLVGFVDSAVQNDDCRVSLTVNNQMVNSKPSFDHTYYNSMVLDISEAKLIEVLRLCCLLLSSVERRRIRLFLDAIRRIVWNANVKITGEGVCTCEQMVCRLATGLFQCKDARQRDPQLTASLTAFFFRYGEFILEWPKQCDTAPSSHFMPANSCSHQGSGSLEVPFTFCSRITRDEYELQSVGGTETELRKLLEDIISNKTISAKTKNNQLKKFEKAYPDIYHERFPVTAIPRTRPPSFRKPLHLLRNLRI